MTSTQETHGEFSSLSSYHLIGDHVTQLEFTPITSDTPMLQLIREKRNLILRSYREEYGVTSMRVGKNETYEALSKMLRGDGTHLDRLDDYYAHLKKLMIPYKDRIWGDLKSKELILTCSRERGLNISARQYDPNLQCFTPLPQFNLPSPE